MILEIQETHAKQPITIFIYDSFQIQPAVLPKNKIIVPLLFYTLDGQKRKKVTILYITGMMKIYPRNGQLGEQKIKDWKRPISVLFHHHAGVIL